MHMFNTAFAAARVSRNLTRAELARLTGFSQSFIASYEQHAINPTAKTLQNYCRALGLRAVIDGNGFTLVDLRMNGELISACDLLDEQAGAPKRIQRKRTKGWRMPPNTISVARPSKWGNPFIVGKDGSAAAVVARFRAWAEPQREQVRKDLAGKDLACFCRLDQPCHADVLLELANSNS